LHGVVVAALQGFVLAFVLLSLYTAYGIVRWAVTALAERRGA